MTKKVEKGISLSNYYYICNLKRWVFVANIIKNTWPESDC